MTSQMAILARTRMLLRAHSRPISTFAFLCQEPQPADFTPTVPSHAEAIPLPPNPAMGSPLYQENWRNPNPVSLSQNLIPLGIASSSSGYQVMSLSDNLDAAGLLNLFAELMTQQRWEELKQFFMLWAKQLDRYGKPNVPDVNLYNHYLRANLMTGASAGDLLDLMAQMESYRLVPNTASFNLVLKAMYKARETVAAEKLLQRMLQTGKESMPDEETYDLVIGMLYLAHQPDAALKYIDKVLKSGYTLSARAFSDCVKSCLEKGRPDTLTSIIQKCKQTEKNKILYPSWAVSNSVADYALQEDNSELAYMALEFLAKWIARGENARPPVLLSVDEGLVVSSLATAGRTYNSKLLDASWAILKRSLRQKKPPNPESFLGKIYALASLGDLQRAFSTLHELESAYGNSTEQTDDLFSPFTSLHPLVVACAKKGFETLDLVYFQLENLSKAEPPYKSVAALNCIILGCANIWDLDRAYQTFEAINSVFGLNPDIHSYNALIYAFGKLKKTVEASRVFDHLVSLGVKPNAMTYSLLVDAHLINRDQKAALSVLNEMGTTGFRPSKETLKKIRRRCIREMDYESDDRLQSLARTFQIRMSAETRRNMLFELDYGTAYVS